MPVARPGHGRADSRSPGPAARAAGRFSRLFLMRRDHTRDWPGPVRGEETRARMERSGDPPKVIRLPGVDSGLGSRGSDFKARMSPSRGRTVYATEVRTPVRWPLICPGRPPVTCSGPSGKALWSSGENSKGRAGSTEQRLERHGRDVRALPCRRGARPQALLGEPGRFCPPTPPCVPNSGHPFTLPSDSLFGCAPHVPTGGPWAHKS